MFKDVIVTKIYEPVTVFSQKGRRFEMKERDCFGLSLCLSGQITYRMGEREFVSRQGTATLLPYGATYTLHGDSDGLFPVIDFDATGLDLKEFLILPLENQTVLAEEYEQLKNAFLAGDRLQVFERFYRMLRQIFPEQAPRPLANVLKYIETHLQKTDLNNQFLAQQMGISEVYLRKLFAKHLQTSPKQYILNARIRKAERLLAETAKSVGVIAEECGFSGPYHFCRAFKQRTGQTPTEYAETHRIFKI